MAARFEVARRIGDVVYEPYSPQKLGRVIEVKGSDKDPYQQEVLVHWKSGDIEWRKGTRVLRLEDLIEDHERKLDGHKTRLVGMLGFPPELSKDVHTEHCCMLHGCKYGNEDCPVALRTKRQSYPCERCQANDV